MSTVREELIQALRDIWDANADADPDEIQRIVDEAVSEVRAELKGQNNA